MKINLRLALFFWGIMYLIVLTVTVTVMDIYDAVLTVTIILVVSILQVYFNLLILIPRFFEKKRYLPYALASVALISFVTLLRMSIHFNVSENMGFMLFGKLSTSEFKWLWSMVMFIVHGGIHLLSLIFKLFFDWEENQRIKSEMKSNQLEAELKLLRLQLNPHFLFNTLNNIYTLVYLKKDNAAPMVMKLSESMRYMLSEANHGHVPLEKEITFLKNYLELSGLKSSQYQKIRMTYNGVKGHHKIAPLLLISFVENMIKHGDIETDHAGSASIRLDVDDEDRLHLIAKNSKGPLSTKVISTGIGLKNIKKRLGLLYPGHRLQIKDGQDTFQVELDIKLTENELHYS